MLRYKILTIVQIRYSFLFFVSFSCLCFISKEKDVGSLFFNNETLCFYFFFLHNIDCSIIHVHVNYRFTLKYYMYQ